ncbi:MAG: fructosamine kinase family protein [Propionibacteriaceae bacterium]
MTGFTKSSAVSPGFYAAEAAGLRWLAAAGGAAVVGVQHVTDDSITLDRLTPGRPTRKAAEVFGRALAVTHASGAEDFGIGPDSWTGAGWIGQQPLSLRPQHPWGAFYAEQRLLPYADKAVHRGNLSQAGRDAVDRVCERLLAGEFDDGRPPSRIHGDLWAGNVMYTDSGVVLIDPAAHGGHALTDLAMLHLFGAPHLETITSAYVESAGPGWPSAWRELIGLHQLHPLLVHAVTHGPSYAAQAESVANRYV